jgi:hypothetical protein
MADCEECGDVFYQLCRCDIKNQANELGIKLTDDIIKYVEDKFGDIMPWAEYMDAVLREAYKRK